MPNTDAEEIYSIKISTILYKCKSIHVCSIYSVSIVQQINLTNTSVSFIYLGTLVYTVPLIRVTYRGERWGE